MKKCISRGSVNVPKATDFIKKKTKVVKGGASSMSTEPSEN